MCGRVKASFQSEGRVPEVTRYKLCSVEHLAVSQYMWIHDVVSAPAIYVLPIVSWETLLFSFGFTASTVQASPVIETPPQHPACSSSQLCECTHLAYTQLSCKFMNRYTHSMYIYTSLTNQQMIQSTHC